MEKDNISKSAKEIAEFLQEHENVFINKSEKEIQKILEKPFLQPDGSKYEWDNDENPLPENASCIYKIMQKFAEKRYEDIKFGLEQLSEFECNEFCNIANRLLFIVEPLNQSARVSDTLEEQ
jgi:hypothetical protein